MKPRHGIYEVESKAVSGLISAHVEPSETFDDPASVCFGDAGTVVADPKTGEWAGGNQSQSDQCRGRGVNLGIFQEIGTGLGDKFTVSVHGDIRIDRPDKVTTRITHCGRIAFCEFGREPAHVDRREPADGLSGFDFRDAQNRSEQRKHFIHATNGVFDHACGCGI